MRSRRLGSLFALISLVACGGAEPSARPAAPAPVASAPAAKKIGAALGAEEKLAAEATVELGEGVKTLVPGGWSLTRLRGGLRARDPEGELTISMLVLADRDAKHAKGALLEHLGRTAPPDAGQESEATDVAGWDQVYEVVHPGSGADPMIFVVNARRKGERVVATLLEGKPGAFNRRNAQMRGIVFGLTMPGVEEEDISKNPTRPLDSERKAQLEAAIDDAMKLTGAPAVAVGVVQDGKIVFTKVVGKKTAGKPEAADAKTRFMIGSVSKSLSTFLIGKLVDEGKVSWTTPVKRLLPTFETGDPAFTDRLTVADTFCACAGMPRKDLELVFEFAKTKPEAALDFFKGVKPTTAFGETFQYSNQMTALGGFLAARLVEKGDLGKAYVAAMKRHVFDPMGMKDTTADFDLGSRTSARPHNRSLLDPHEVVLPLPMDMERFVSANAPAGAIFSTVEDMERYAIVELQKGVTPEGKRVISEASLLERRKPRTKASATAWYGLGLGVGKRKGLTVVSHDGGTFGFSTRLYLLPERNVGLVIMTNVSDGDVLGLITGRFMEIVFDEKPRALEDLKKSLHESQARVDKMRKEDLGPVPEEVSTRLVGRYTNDRIGPMVVTLEKGKDRPLVDVGEWKSAVGYKKEGEVEKLTLIDPPVGGMAIRIDGRDLVIDFQQDSYRLAREK